jgi:hypothetical protein
MKIAALYVQSGGCYFNLPDVDPWDQARDARSYEGPWPVVAHPPCERWGRYWAGSPATHGRYRLGDDGGCFAAALASVRAWRGVLEHPEGSHAWRAFSIPAPPRAGGWVPGRLAGEWTCCVAQGRYGHQAQKRTWLLCVNGRDTPPPDLIWGPTGQTLPPVLGETPAQRARRIKTGVCQNLSKRQRAATPPAFRDLLLSLARSTY